MVDQVRKSPEVKAVNYSTDSNSTMFLCMVQAFCCDSLFFESSVTSYLNNKSCVRVLMSTIFSSVRDRYPPARVLDLKATYMQENSSLRLEWSAPGDDLGEGTGNAMI